MPAAPTGAVVIADAVRFRSLSADFDLDGDVDLDDFGHLQTYYVTPDYLGIGSDADFVRMPMMPGTAQQIADLFQCILPARKMVNDIYAQAQVKLAPYPFNLSKCGSCFADSLSAATRSPDRTSRRFRI